MLTTKLLESRRLEVLCLGAHSDDIEIGCGATMLRLVDQVEELTVRWVVFSGDGRRRDEALASASEFLSGASRADVKVEGFRDGFFPHDPAIKEYVEALKKTTSPDVIFTHYRNDLHQDHRVLNELAWNTFRDHVILEYEVPKYDGDLGAPSFYAPAARTMMERKVELVLKHFATQSGKHWLDRETLLGLARIRGVECRAAEGLAEAFYARKLVG